MIMLNYIITLSKTKQLISYVKTKTGNFATTPFNVYLYQGKTILDGKPCALDLHDKTDFDVDFR